MILMKRQTYVLATAALFMTVLAATFITHSQQNANQTSQAVPVQKKAQAIPVGTYFDQAKKLSVGKKPACLANTPTAEAAIKNDDTYVDNNPEWSRFELAASAGIADVPAGTNFETTTNSYDGKIAFGTIVYDKQYGSYNYLIQKNAGAGQWQLTTFTACH